MRDLLFGLALFLGLLTGLVWGWATDHTGLKIVTKVSTLFQAGDARTVRLMVKAAAPPSFFAAA